MADRQNQFDAWVNPLRFTSLEGPPFRPEGAEVDYSGLLAELGSPETDNSIESIKQRYTQLTAHDADLFLVPAHNLILQKLVWPLRVAKQAFCLGNYLGCIALCGTVSEMTTIFLFDLVGPTVNGSKLDATAQKQLFGSPFEKLGQERRLQVLEAYGILKKDLVDEANQIRSTRRAYLHILNKELSRIQADAEIMYRCAAHLVKEVVAFRPGEGGMVTMSPQLAEYLGKNNETSTS